MAEEIAPGASLNLFLKFEGLNPTGSFKDRGMTVAISQAMNEGAETVICASAIVNGMYLFRVNRVGREEEQDFYGRSFCVSPEGTMLMPPSGMSNGVIMADIDRNLIEENRREWKFFGDRREEAYGG